MNRKLLYSFFLCAFAFIIMCQKSFAQTSATAASAIWQPASSSNIPGSVAVSGNIQANEQGGTLEAYTYSTTATAISNASGFQRLRSTLTAPALPFGNVYDPAFYVEYKVQPASGKYLRVTELKLTALGGGTGNARLVVKYSTNGTAFTDMPVTGNYFLADGTATNYGGTEAQPVVLINSGSAALTEDKRTLSYTGMSVNLDPGQFLTVRLYPYLTDMTAPSSRYLFTRNLVISAFSQDTTLPLDFLSFSGKADALGKTVDLNWSTTNEVNTKSFDVQRKTAGSDFVTMGTLACKNTAGVHNYSFTDQNAANGTAYYRISQSDNNGASKLSNVIAVSNKAVSALSVYPNPVDQTLNIKHASAAAGANLEVLSLDGKTMFKKAVTVNSISSNLDVSKLATGTYLLILDNNTEKSSLKFVKK